EGESRKQQKHQLLGPYKFTHQQLEKEGVIQKSNVPEKQRDTIYINVIPKRLTTSFTMYETDDFADAARYLLVPSSFPYTTRGSCFVGKSRPEEESLGVLW
ncbi:hypothetical protein BK809_0005223, partial [Diplodia seriata]